ncbi:MAG: flavin reductase [Gammaproteobacteria bacterium]|nr:flavin reductase [Gammaproteobacteria bacterium]
MKRFDQAEFRQALGKFATGITVVTTTGKNNTPLGVTVNSFTSVSLEPPLVLWCLDLNANCYDEFANCDSFAIHVLHKSQEATSRNFAENNGDKFADIDWKTGDSGSPVLQDCAVCLQCKTEQIYSGGDHSILLGRVEIIESFNDADPLIYHGGAYRFLQNK